jgi:hypothetical protein
VAFYLNVTAEQLRHLFRSRERGRPFAAPERRLSLYADIDAAHSRSLSSYAEQWGEARTSLRREWQGITRDVWMQATSDERQWTPQAERYVALAGMEYDKSIPDRTRTAMQHAETFRPAAETVEALIARTDRGQKRTDRGQKPGPNGHDNADSGQMLDRNGQIVDRQSNTSSTSGSSKIPPDTSYPPPKGAARKAPRRFTPPSLSEVRPYFEALGRADLSEPFFDHFTANGWKVGGKAAMKDWKAAARTWLRNDAQFSGKRNGHTAGNPAGHSGSKDYKRAHEEAKQHPAAVYERARAVAAAALGDG